MRPRRIGHRPLAGSLLAHTLGLAATLALAPAPAWADRIGASSLPKAAPPLKGRISEDGATRALVVSTGAGATTNAGPTLLERPSAFIDHGLAYAQIVKSPFGRWELTASLNDRRYTNFSDADTLSGAASASLTHSEEASETRLTFAVSSGRDVEERLTESSLVLETTASKGAVRPYVRAEAAYLDFRDLPGTPDPFQSQDDRDRLSARIEGGLRLTLSDDVTLKAGAGADVKRYRAATDDFGVARDSISVFPLIGIAYAGERATLRAVYAPFLRMYRERLFPDAWKHGYRIEGQVKLATGLEAFGAARYGFEETDFLIASAAYERVVVAGLTLAIGKGSLSFAASRTWRDYDGLGLLAIARADEKTEVGLSGEWPLSESLSLNSRVSYLAYESSFGFVETDALTASLGLSYVVTQ